MLKLTWLKLFKEWVKCLSRRGYKNALSIYICAQCILSAVKLTQYSNNFIILDYFQRPRNHKAKAVDTLAGVVDQVSRGTVHCLKFHGKCSKAPIARQPEGWVLLENFAVQMHTDICSHVLRAYLQNLRRKLGNQFLCMAYMCLLSLVHSTGFKNYFPPSFKISNLSLYIYFYIIYTHKPQY